ncbi:MAG TPA: hypothetical protein VLA24_13455 [Pseudomonadales bacterium]|nr:hypothetical protein [Pseudomonadales bacterium]
MFTKPAVLIAAIASFSLFPHGVNADKNYTYQGGRSAQKICKSIVQDRLKQLKIQLLRASKFNAIPYRTIHNYYACNDLALIDFAHDVGAVHTVGYLKTRGAVRTQVLMEEVAVR